MSILKKQFVQSQRPSTSLVSQYKLFCQIFSLEQIIKHATYTKYSSSKLIDHILTNSREKISQSGVLDISISYHQLIYRTLTRMKSNTHKKIKIRSIKNCIIESLNQGLRVINFPDNEHFIDVDIVYADFIQCITPVINKIVPFKDIRIRNYSQDWPDGEILVKIILKKFKPSSLNIEEQLHLEAEINVQRLIKNIRRGFYKEKLGKSLLLPRKLTPVSSVS